MMAELVREWIALEALEPEMAILSLGI
jgi:hypothetical protein